MDDNREQGMGNGEQEAGNGEPQANEAARSLESLRQVAKDIDELEMALTRDGKKMGEIAMALRLDGFADRINQALGEMPRPHEGKEDFAARQETLRRAFGAAMETAGDAPPPTPAQDEPRSMSKAEAIGILAGMAMKRRATLGEVEALQLALRSLVKRMCDAQKWRKRKAEARAEAERKFGGATVSAGLASDPIGMAVEASTAEAPGAAAGGTPATE